MEGKNIWRPCKTYGRLIGYPMLKPHDLRHSVGMEVYEQHDDLEQARGLLGHTQIETTQLYAQIRPAALKHAVDFYESKALDVLGSQRAMFEDDVSMFESRRRRSSKTET